MKIWRILFIWLITGAFGVNVSAQQTSSNPFEVRELPEMTTSDEATPASTNPFELERPQVATPPVTSPAATKTEENPFDLQRPTAPNKTEAVAPTSTNPFERQALPTAKPPTIEPTPSTPQAVETSSGSNFLFWSLLTMMIFFAVLITLYRPLLGKIYRAFSNDNILKLLHREQGYFVSFPYLLYYIFFVISVGIFTYQVAQFYEWLPEQFSSLAYCVLGVAAISVLKHIALKMVGSIFPINREIRLYSFTIVIFSIILGILLIPFDILIAYSPGPVAQLTLYIALGALFIFYGFRSLRSLFIASRYLMFHKFHFFMYLCTVEIAPVVLLVKLLSN